MRALLLSCFLVILFVPNSGHLEAQAPDARNASLSNPFLAWRSGLGESVNTPSPTPPAASAAADAKPSGSASGVVLATTVDVVAAPAATASSGGFERSITPRDIETSAGTFGDPSRFFQTLAGVISDNDQRNDFLVRGGNPSENAFVIDNIEIPSINQLALSDTTGGFVSMLDAAAIQRMTLHTDAYDSKYDQRLSSIVDISTRPEGRVEAHSIAELGIAGLGGSTARPFGNSGSFFVSARESVLQYVTNDIGLDGVPIYRNAFFRAENRIDDSNSWWGISLTGIDSLLIHPSATDPDETSTFDISYKGWRNTTGVNWQHIFSARSFGVASLAHSEQSQSVIDDDQLQGEATVYNEHSADGISSFKYDWTFQPSPRLTLTAGARVAVDQLNYSVAQPIGLQNPYSSDPTPLDATAMARRFATVSSAAYVQAVFALPLRARLVVGERGMQWALGGNRGSTPEALFSIPIFGKLTHIGYSEYEQLASTLYLLTFNNIKAMGPIRSHQLTGGVTLAENHRARVTAEIYQKTYSNYPVALNYPQLSMANIADTFGQAFLMFPMVGQGKGLARGAELTVETHPTAKLDVTATLAYARNWYSGLDGILRRGNYDVPLTATVSGVWRIAHGVVFSWRTSAASGRVYTPDNMALSTAQDRDVYDLTRINAVRSQSYQRLDFRFEQARKVAHGTLLWHVGLQNATNHKNFYSNVWEPRVDAVTEQDQMPLFPDGGIKYTF